MTLVDLRPRTAEGASNVRQWDWCSGPCVALEHTFELRVEPGSDFRRTLEPMIAPFRVRSGVGQAPAGCYEIRADDEAPLPYTLFFNDGRVASGRFASDLGGMLAWHINHTVIERSVGHHVLLHSAAAVRGGLTVILPADQESGKTTTVAGLLRNGFDYVTDEAVAINPSTGWIVPFPKTLSLDPGSWSLFPECSPADPGVWTRQWQVPAQRLGARVVGHAVPPPRVIVFPKYVAGAVTTAVPLSRSEAVRELARMSFDFPRYAARNLSVLGRVASGATTARLVIGSLDDAVMAIEGLVSERLLEEL